MGIEARLCMAAGVGAAVTGALLARQESFRIQPPTGTRNIGLRTGFRQTKTVKRAAQTEKTVETRSVKEIGAFAVGNFMAGCGEALSVFPFDTGRLNFSQVPVITYDKKSHPPFVQKQKMGPFLSGFVRHIATDGGRFVKSSAPVVVGGQGLHRMSAFTTLVATEAFLDKKSPLTPYLSAATLTAGDLVTGPLFELARVHKATQLMHPDRNPSVMAMLKERTAPQRQVLESQGVSRPMAQTRALLGTLYRGGTWYTARTFTWAAVILQGKKAANQHLAPKDCDGKPQKDWNITQESLGTQMAVNATVGGTAAAANQVFDNGYNIAANNPGYSNRQVAKIVFSNVKEATRGIGIRTGRFMGGNVVLLGLMDQVAAKIQKMKAQGDL